MLGLVDYRQFYTEKMVDAIEERFGSQFRDFGYEFDQPASKFQGIFFGKSMRFIAHRGGI